MDLSTLNKLRFVEEGRVLKGKKRLQRNCSLGSSVESSGGGGGGGVSRCQICWLVDTFKVTKQLTMT